jgi:ribosomal protein S14
VDAPPVEENDRSSENEDVKADVAAENEAVAMVQEAIPGAEVELPDCSSCGNKVESVDQADLSRIRFREILCKTCHTARKGAKK